MFDGDITKITNISTDPERYIPAEIRELMKPQPDAPPDPIAKYGAPMFDGENWIRHFIDVPNGKTHSLCGLELLGVDRNADVWRTCDECGHRHAEMRAK